MSDFGFLILILYFFTCCGIFVTKFLNSRIGLFLSIIFSSLSFFMVSVRPDSFPDVLSYNQMFIHASSGNFENPFYWAAHGEPGFKVLSFLLSELGFDFSDFKIFLAVLSFLLLLLISYLSNVNFSYIWFSYFSLFFITRDLGVVRLGLSSHFIVLFFLIGSRFYKSISILVSTTFFQYFSFLVIFLSFFKRYHLTYKLFFILLFLSFFFSKFVNPDIVSIYFPSLLETYSDTYHVKETASLFPIIRTLIFALVVFFFLRNMDLDFRIKLLIISAFFSFFSYVVFYDVLILSQRFSAYFGSVLTVLLSYILSHKTKFSYNFYIIFCLCFLNFATVFIFNSFVWL